MTINNLSQSEHTLPTVSKETYYRVKRDLLQCQKRPTTYGLCSPSEHTLPKIFLMYNNDIYIHIMYDNGN